MRVLEKRNHYENRTEVIIYLQNRANNNTGRIKGSYAKYEIHKALEAMPPKQYTAIQKYVPSVTLSLLDF